MYGKCFVGCRCQDWHPGDWKGNIPMVAVAVVKYRSHLTHMALV